MKQRIDERWIRKEYRRKLGSAGWILVIYYLIMNLSVFIGAVVEMAVKLISGMRGQSLQDTLDSMMNATGGAWGYFLAAAIGLAALLIWKKPAFWREEIWEKGAPMKPGAFLGLLCLFMCGQLIYQIMVITLEVALNAFGLSILEGIAAMAMDPDDFGMFLYGGILAPVTEELLFRGLLQRELQPYGKKFAIFCSAFTFGIFHGNILQTPYAFLVGLVLGYVAMEYSIGWAMVLHMINNLVVADMLARLTGGLPEMAQASILWVILLACAIGAVVTVIRYRNEIGCWMRRERMNRFCLRCFFSSGGVITLLIIMGLSIVLSTFILIGPL